MEKKLTSIIKQQPKLTSQIGNTLIYVDPDLEDRNVDITENGMYTITAGDGYDALNTVEIKAEVAPVLQDKTVEITENGTANIIADEGYDGLGNVEVTSNVVSKYAPEFISFAYYSGSNLTELLKNVDTSNITSMRYSFSNIKTTITQEALSYLDTSSVTDAERMFYATNNTELDITSLDLSRVTKMSYMFSANTNLTKVNMSNVTGENVTHIEGIFNYSRKVSYVDMRSFDFSNVTSSASMFFGVASGCYVIVKDEEAKAFVKKQQISNGVYVTNVKTVAELGQ